MKIYNLTKERLMKFDFKPVEFNWCADIGVVAFQRDNISVFVKLYEDIKLSNEIIVKDVIKIRRNLEKSLEVNIWNCYMLACLSPLSISYMELIMKVEKDTTAIRKYIIQQEKDLDRVPFLDNTGSENARPELPFHKDSFTELGNIQEIVDFVHEYTFEKGEKLTSHKVNKVLKEIHLKELIEHEDQKD
ncbi:ABC-three component system middle component 1 [Priestia aryabhattai]|uniref:ABC-three component system middle component 1 n=1 Tax=Priestia aryabhattai TaxID=412384 RepID=UPI001CCF63BF|nr:ABC-three component system middle component 1 [Priestia aryabhattai]MBZ6489535.1 hypothetical protein [Priestia aryabhattai]